MRPSYFALLPILCWLIGQDRGFAQTPPTAQNVTNPAATALLDASIKTLSRPEGVDVKFRLNIISRSEPAVITGQSITADPKRVHIELKYKQVERTGTLKLLCDGNTFYRIESVGDQNAYATYTMKDLQEALAKLATNEAERVAKDDVEKEQQGIHGFEGIAAMVRDLKTRMIFSEPKAATLTFEGKSLDKVMMIEGRWTEEVLEMIAPVKKGNDPNQQDQRYLWNEKLYFFTVPRLARLYFEAGNQRLLRLELLGITEKQGPDKVLSFVDVLSTTPLATLDAKLFVPSEAELKFKKVDIDLVSDVKTRHQQTMNILKMQQQMQK